MSTKANDPNGTFIWREIMTTDVAASKRFYGEVFGWTFDDMPMDGFTYVMIKHGTTGIGGMASLDSMPGAPPHWIGTVCVADVDASAKAASEAGGKVMMPPGDIAGYGRFAVIADPQGAPLTLMHPVSDEPARTTMPGVGEFCWEHLNATDAAGAKAFYGKVLGWEAAGSVTGSDVFKLGERMIASLGSAAPGLPAHWLTYVVVDDLAAARARVTNHGGKIVMEEHAVPTMGVFSVVSDNVGAIVCLFKSN